jgi:hypothetical protein
MAKRANKTTPLADPVELAAQVVQVVTEVLADPVPLDALPPADFVPEVAPAASDVTAKRSRTAKGGARGSKLTPEQRSENARKAAAARWKKK